MKKTVLALSLVTILLIMNPALSEAQFRSERNTPSITQQIATPYSPSNSSLVLGFIDPSRLDMQQSYSVTFSSVGSRSGAVGIYTNRLSYMILPNLQVIADIGLMHQPFQGQGGDILNLDNSQLLYGGEVRYRPTENSFISVRFGNTPNPYYYRDSLYGNRYYQNGYYPYSPYFGY